MNKEKMTEAEEYDRFLRTYITAITYNKGASEILVAVDENGYPLKSLHGKEAVWENALSVFKKEKNIGKTQIWIDGILKKYSKTELNMIIQYLADKETKEWEAILKDDNSLTIENIKKVFDNGWQWWNTYAEDMCVPLVDGNGIGCENVNFDLIDWNKVIHLTETDKNFRYNLHQYADYACIFMDFEKDGISINSPFLNNNALTHLIEDVESGMFKKADLDNMLAERKALKKKQEKELFR